MMTGTTAASDLSSLRAAYPVLGRRIEGKRLVYLDNACTALKPAPVVERQAAFYRDWGVCGGKRSTHLLSQGVESILTQARREITDFLGAESPNEVVFTSGTTESVNLVARAFPYEDGRDEVVLTDLEHNSVFLPFYEAQRRGEVRLRFARTQEGRLDPSEIERLVTDKTALVAMTRSSNVFGGVLPAAEVCRAAHRRGAKVLLDEAQYLPTHREDVQALDADFVAFSGHKLGGPFGTGVLYGKENLLNGLKPHKVGGGTVKSVRWDGLGDPEVDYLDAPPRFEAGIQDYAGIAGLAEAIRFRGSVPEKALRDHISGLVRMAAQGLSSVPEVRVLGRLDDLSQGSIVSFHPVHPGFSVADFNLFLNHELGDHFIAVRAGEHCAHLLHQRLKIPATVRLSFLAYNTEEEVGLFLEALGAYVREACRG